MKINAGQNSKRRGIRNNALWLTLRHTPRGLLVILIFTQGLVLRGPVTAYAPIASVLESDLGVNLAQVGLLTGLPVFCFAAFTPIASWVIKRWGLDAAVACGLTLSAVGILTRSFGGYPVLLASTVIIGAGISFGNTSFPLLAARDFPAKFALVTGASSAAMNIGSFAATGSTYPLASLVGWRWTLELWLFIVGFCALLLFAYIKRRQRGGSRKSLRSLNKVISDYAVRNDASASAEVVTAETPAVKSRNIYKLRFTYLVTFVFICQCFSYFSCTAWLPQIFESLGQDPAPAGFAASYFQIVGIFGSLGASFLIKKFNFRGAFAIIVAGWISLPLGLLFAPSLWFVWMVLSGFAQGANYIIMFAKVQDETNTPTETRQMSSFVQMISYAVAGVSPSICGALFGATGSWTVVLAIVATALFSMGCVGLFSYKRIKPRL